MAKQPPPVGRGQQNPESRPLGLPTDNAVIAELPDGQSAEDLAMEQQALAVSGEGDSPTSDDRVGTVEHIEDMPNLAPEGMKPASLESILKKDREDRSNGKK